MQNSATLKLPNYTPLLCANPLLAKQIYFEVYSSLVLLIVETLSLFNGGENIHF